MSELRDISHFATFNDDERTRVAAELADRLGPDWRASDPAGSERFIALVYEPGGVEFVAIPGGEFEMGWGSQDEELAHEALRSSKFVDGFLAKLRAVARPTRQVRVSAFLCSRDRLTRWQLQALKPDWPTDEFTRESALEFVGGSAFRLPTEAEVEWVSRAGGEDAFIADLAAQHTPGSSYSVQGVENRWGVANLLGGQWVADDWHDDYEGAPETASAWMGGDSAGVFRGGLGTYVEGDSSLLYALAAHRSRGDFADGLIGMRLALSLPS